jgi:hypothetical protein
MSENMSKNWSSPVFTEKYDDTYLKVLSNIGHADVEHIMRSRGKSIDGERTSVREQTQKVREICKSALRNKNKREIHYKYSKKNPKDGRLYSYEPSLQNIMGCFRGLLSGSTAIDFDAVNCHPVLLLAICKEQDVYCPQLVRYVSKREEIIKEFCQQDDLTRSEAKEMFLIAINSEKMRKKKNKKENIKYTFFLDFDKEIKSIQVDLADKFIDEFKMIKRREQDNYFGKFMARILNIEENKMLQTACDAIHGEYPVMSLVFDGLMVYRYKDGAHVDEDKVVEALVQATKKWKMDWKVKEPDYSIQEYVENEISLDAGDVMYAGTEAQLVKMIFHEFYNYKLYKSHSDPYMLINRQWVRDKSRINDVIYRQVIELRGYVSYKTQGGDIENKLVTQSLSSAGKIADAVYKMVPENTKLLDELEKRCFKKISFSNGYWDFDQNDFIPYEDGDGYDTINLIDREFKYIEKDDPLRQQVFDKIIYKMFCIDDETSQDYPVMENYLHWMARAMAGITTDKIWFMLQGQRDSAKGVFDGLLRNAFGSYIGNFSTKSFKLDAKGSQDSDLKQKFLLKNRYARIAPSQETDDCWLDGELVKKASSGGDTIEARNLYENTVSFVNSCKYMFVGNESARIKPADALQTQWYYKMRCKFVDDPDNVADPDVNIRYYRKDDSVKRDFINQDDVLNAFCSILFDYYERRDTHYPKELKCEDDVNVDVKSETRMLFDITKDDNDFMSNAELKSIYNDNKDIYDNLAHMKRMLKGMGVKDARTKTQRGMSGLRVKGSGETDE